MPMSATEIERKITQLDNDVSEIYTMIADVQNTQRRHTHRFAEMGSRLDGMVDRLGGVESRLDTIETRLGTVETTLTGLAGTVEAMAATLTRVADAVLPPGPR